MVHATNFAESTNDCTIRIEKYSPLWRIFFSDAAVFTSLFCIYTVHSQQACICFLEAMKHFFGQLIITAMGMNKIFKSIHPTYIHIFCLNSFMVVVVVSAHLHMVFFIIHPMNIALHSPSIFGNLFWYLYTLLLFCRKSVYPASKQTSGCAS